MAPIQYDATSSSEWCVREGVQRRKGRIAVAMAGMGGSNGGGAGWVYGWMIVDERVKHVVS